MSVLPDAISYITPVVDLQVAFGEGEGIHDHGGSGGDVVPGCFVGAEKVRNEIEAEIKKVLTLCILTDCQAADCICHSCSRRGATLHTGYGRYRCALRSGTKIRDICTLASVSRFFLLWH
jgi:hypothetical protein